MPIKVWRQIVRLQRNFLWGGVRGANKIAWVSWSNVCRPKSEGGLGVCDLRMVNLALLGKWRWRLISGAEGLWKDILRARYDPLGCSSHLGGRVGSLDQLPFGGRTSLSLGPFMSPHEIGSPQEINFQGYSMCPPTMMRKLGVLVDGTMGCGLGVSMEESSFCLGERTPLWAPCVVGLYISFSVCSFLVLEAPLKVVVFSWKLLQDRIPSRQNLLRRRVIATPESAICALCGLSGESSVHLFISCPVVSSAWYSVSYWLG
ncbi:hypothetical protein TSUD_189600 [Trifolium subterraneum]|uniref:Reverse transcriptase zinc-binding domain-containing protein n=1 Tax=Trifolium subterraneum TaxID=3900 RepID=A0A2Z6LVV2_TRISU|nr:hypothetical protein TSUD_189600 [Trifolium subterraneum]